MMSKVAPQQTKKMAEETEQKSSTEAQLHVTSSQWLQDGRSLKTSHLSLDKLLPRLGFRQKEGKVPGSTSSITSVYAEGCFLQHPDSAGRVYNVCAGDGVMETEERKLQDLIHQLQARLEWLNTNSRLLFGVMVHRQIVLVLDSTMHDSTRLQPFLLAATSVVKEQLSSTNMFTIIRCCGGLDKFSDRLEETNDETISRAIEWLKQTTPISVNSRTNVVEAMEYATRCQHVDAVYLYSQGNSSLRAYNALNEKLAQSPVPVYISVYECWEQVAVDQYVEMAAAAHTRLHLYNQAAPVHHPHRTPPSSRPSSARSTASSRSSTSSKKLPPSVPREDVLLVWEELEEARDTLAELQAIRLELREKSDQYTRAPPPPQAPHEDYMSSVQWLAEQGIKQNKMMFDDLVASLAFQHCEGVLKRPDHSAASNSIGSKMITSTRIQAQYCRNFVHMKWRDDRIVHVHLPDRSFNNYRNTLHKFVNAYKKRMAWLKRGSRELFGTITENNVVIAVDTSSSLRSRLSLVKRKLQQLMEQQLRHKQHFNLIQFSSEVLSWREYLVPPAAQNLSSAHQWVTQLQAGGSTDTLGVLRKAMGMDGVEGVYLLTDGRPDQSPDTIFGQIHRMKQIPVHTISFNCADSKANRFLSRLAAVTGGRYHYYCEDVSDPNGPPAHRSDDLRLLEEELELAEQQLQSATELREECVRLQQCTPQHTTTSTPAVTSYHHNRQRSYNLRKSNRSYRPGAAVMSCEIWLQQNSLTARRLTLMDALGPAAVPHNPKHTPILDKHVRGKVFEEVLSHAHLSGSGQVSLINPRGVDLPGYTKQLDSYIAECGQQLVSVVWSSLSHGDREELQQDLDLTQGEQPSHGTHWEKMKAYLTSHGLTEGLDLQPLEEEMAQAVAYRDQATALYNDVNKKKSKQKNDELLGNDEALSLGSLVSSITMSSVASLSLSHLSSKGSHQWPVGKKAKLKQYLKGHHVIACSTQDGLYYPGTVVTQPDTHHSLVRFQNHHQERIANTEMVLAHGAGPCPPLHIGDYVLARVRAKRLSDSDVYIPGVVSVLPVNPRVAIGLHTVCAVGGRSLVCSRRALVKIGRARYMKMCAHLTTLLTMKKTSEQTQPACQSEQQSQEESDEEDKQSKSEEEEEHTHSGYFDTRDDDPAINTEISSVTSQTISNISCDSRTVSPAPRIEMVDRATSPLPLMVDKGTATDPVMRSVGVLTEPLVQDMSVETVWENNDDTLETTIATEGDDKNSNGKHENRVDEHGQEEEDSGGLSLSMLQHSAHSPQNLINAKVLARWMDDGWYYRSMVVDEREKGWYQVKDASGAMEVISRDDIITDQEDADRLLRIGDPVIALHPSYPLSYAPGRITGILTDGLHFNVEMYDDTQVMLPRQEVYTVCSERHMLAIDYIKECEQAWIGKTVIARRDSDTLFHPGVVTEMVDNSPQYVIQWKDGTTQLQSPLYMFGELTTKRPLHIGDYVIAQADPLDDGVYDTGRIMDIQGDKLIILLSNGENTLAAPEKCYWVTREYYTSISPNSSE